VDDAVETACILIKASDDWLEQGRVLMLVHTQEGVGDVVRYLEKSRLVRSGEVRNVAQIVEPSPLRPELAEALNPDPCALTGSLLSAA
jgi:hypothetical protein